MPTGREIPTQTQKTPLKISITLKTSFETGILEKSPNMGFIVLSQNWNGRACISWGVTYQVLFLQLDC